MRRVRNSRITHAGKTLTLREWAKELGVDPRFIYNRIKRGYSEQDAVSIPKHENFLSFTHNGETLTNKEWAKMAGVTPHAFFMRVRKLGWSMEKALTTPLRVYEEPEGRMEIGERAQPGQRFSFSL